MSPMIAETFKINSTVVSRLMKFKANEKLAHAYIFVGPALSGKFETALEIAKMLNCESLGDSACGQCPQCIKIAAGNHPDVHVTASDPFESIKIEQVRDILGQIRLRAFMAKTKVFLVKNVEMLTSEAANALLKTLEEPTPSSLLILTTASFENVLDTIKSRCHWMFFAPESADIIKSFITKEYALTGPQAHCVAYFSQGCLGKAKDLLDHKFIERKNQLIDGFVFSANSDALIKEIAAEKADTKEFLMIMISWVRDMILLKSSVMDERIIHQDRIKDLAKLKDAFDSVRLDQAYKQLIKAVDLVNENLNVKMTLLILKETLSYG